MCGGGALAMQAQRLYIALQRPCATAALWQADEECTFRPAITVKSHQIIEAKEVRRVPVQMWQG